MHAAEEQMENWKAKIESIVTLEKELDAKKQRIADLETALQQAERSASEAHSLRDQLDASREQISMLQHCAEAVHSYGSAWLPLTESLKDTAQRDAAEFSALLQSAKTQVRDRPGVRASVANWGQRNTLHRLHLRDHS